MKELPMHSCSLYYRGYVCRDRVWFFVATLRSFEHLAFDRTHDVATSEFEFFVSPDLEDFFLKLMAWYASQGIIRDVRKITTENKK